MSDYLPYSEWKILNLKPVKKRHQKKFELLYKYNHPRYADYCFRIARSKEPQGKRSYLSMNILTAALHSAYTDVSIKEYVYADSLLLKLLPKTDDSMGEYITLPLENYES